MFRLFNKEKKLSNRQKELELLKSNFCDKYQCYFNSYCLYENIIVVYKYVEIKDNKCLLYFKSSNTFDGYISYGCLESLIFIHDEDFIKNQRLNFIKLKSNLEKMNLKLEKVK